jgi:hypothetical protein
MFFYLCFPKLGVNEKELMKNEKTHERMARGGHELPKVSLGPSMLYPFTPCRRPPVKHGGRPATIFYPLGYPTC